MKTVKLYLQTSTTPIVIMAVKFLPKDGSEAMTGDLDLASYHILWDDVELRATSTGLVVWDRGASAVRDLTCRLCYQTDFRFPLAAPASPVSGSVYYQTVTKRLYIYGGFPPAWKYVLVDT